MSYTICTGNPEQLWAWDDPSEGGNVHTVMSEQGIFDTVFEWYHKEMLKIGKGALATRENCIDDFLLDNWAYKVEKDK